ncbi:MAG: hypothetical protein PHO48_00855 [Candidatus Gracilibacteria bacterium]|nr:hypothetical protein [Candidatus Gracilibacteria bacterium]MDD5179503.1 hypothetical protein [Candidatus Gracilibacteria bacterium]
MSFNLKLRVKPSSKLPKVKLEEIILKALREVLDCECEILENTEELVMDTKLLHKELDSYAEKLEEITTTLTLVANDFDTTNPFAKKLIALRKKKAFTQEDANTLSKAQRIASRAPILTRIKRFLVKFPEDKRFDKLRFMQDLVKQNLPFPEVFEKPELVDAVALQAFENYRSEYTKLYLELIEEREKATQIFWKQLTDLKQKLFTLTSLDKVAKLGKPLATNFAEELEDLLSRYKSLNLTLTEMRKILNLEPTLSGITFFSASPTLEFESFTARLEAALGSKLLAIKEKSILKILSNSKEASVKKLVSLLSLTSLEKITKLFTPVTAPRIIAEFTKLLR